MRSLPLLAVPLLAASLAGCGTSASGEEDALVESGDFADRYPLEAAWPEGGAYDADGHAFFVGSLGDGSVHRIDAATGEDETIFVETAPGAWWTLGMAVDPAARVLWVCAMEDLRGTGAEPAYDGYVWRFDLDTMARQAIYPLDEAAPEATCTDVAVADDGAVFVTDRDFGRVYRLTAEDGPSLFAEDEALEANLIGQNAAVVLPDQSALLVILYLHPALLRVDLETGAVSEVDIDGSFFDATPLSGADGMTLYGDRAYVAFGSELVEVTSTADDWSSARASEVTVPNGMTDVISTPDGLYLLNGQAVRYALKHEPKPFALERFTGSFP